MKRYNTVAGVALILSLCYSLLFAGQGYIESLKFKDTDIRLVLDAISREAQKEGENINIIVTPEVEGLVSIDLRNIDWRTALKVILKTYNYAYTQRRDIITVSGGPSAPGLAGLKMEVFKLKYLYADTAKNLIAPFLSPDGKISVLDIPQEKIGSLETASSVSSTVSIGSTTEGKTSHSKVLIVYDTPDKLDQLSTLLSELDVMPKQVLIQAIIMEVNRDTLRDIGFDWGTGKAGASDYDTPPSDIALNQKDTMTVAGRNLASEFTPSAFNPLEGTSFPGKYPYSAGLEVLFKKIRGTQFELILHALEEDGRTNTLSKPIILTVDNQLASILIGTKFPIIETQTSSESSYIVGGSLQQYMDIGIQLRVKPQICGPNGEYINLLLHPVVSSYTQTSKVTTQTGATLVEYPIINTREAETQMLVKDGETIVMGGLLKDVKSHEDLGIPFLRKIPLLGKLFNRSTKDYSKVDLMIFITAKIVRPGEVLPAEVLDTEKFKAQFNEQQNKKKQKEKRNHK